MVLPAESGQPPRLEVVRSTEVGGESAPPEQIEGGLEGVIPGVQVEPVSDTMAVDATEDLQPTGIGIPLKDGRVTHGLPLTEDELAAIADAKMPGRLPSQRLEYYRRKLKQRTTGNDISALQDIQERSRIAKD